MLVEDFGNMMDKVGLDREGVAEYLPDELKKKWKAEEAAERKIEKAEQNAKRNAYWKAMSEAKKKERVVIGKDACKPIPTTRPLLFPTKTAVLSAVPPVVLSAIAKQTLRLCIAYHSPPPTTHTHTSLRAHHPDFLCCCLCPLSQLRRRQRRRRIRTRKGWI